MYSEQVNQTTRHYNNNQAKSLLSLLFKFSCKKNVLLDLLFILLSYLFMQLIPSGNTKNVHTFFSNPSITTKISRERFHKNLNLVYQYSLYNVSDRRSFFLKNLNSFDCNAFQAIGMNCCTVNVSS